MQIEVARHEAIVGEQEERAAANKQAVVARGDFDKRETDRLKRVKEERAVLEAQRNAVGARVMEVGNSLTWLRDNAPHSKALKAIDAEARGSEATRLIGVHTKERDRLGAELKHFKEYLKDAKTLRSGIGRTEGSAAGSTNANVVSYERSIGAISESIAELDQRIASLKRQAA